ncbi:PREDICTED: putative FBD-associated F-box protein At1g05080 [Camelina sativa]|uniref:FBD-associated F-box protein At1g05080 n=1 Tax=Camelina sativa TaxID=90675 RepID=A0ABM1QC53_CAMSA|nr:PREDICTED: putative FBD-associated F-box protein At1g05080 [Camelina sativa]
MIQNANCCGVSRIEETVPEDRISALPEDLLVMILDLVPTKDAVATMFLSKRWFSVWTMKQRLEYIDMEDESKKSVWRFLEKSLQLHRAPVISNLCIVLGPSCPTDADVGKLVANAVDRSVLEMKLQLLWSADPAILPKTLYSCQSLVTLTLSDKILVDVPSSASLPSLTTLYLHDVLYKDDDSLVKLLSSCPVLEKLFVKRNKKDDNVTRFRVEMPNLLCVSYKNLRDDSGVADTGRYLVIVTSALTHFEIFDASGDSRSMEMPSLDSATIAIASYPDDKFLRSVFASQGHTTKDLPLSWIQPSSVPGCLSSQLEDFEWYAYVGREEEEQFLTYLLANSNCLKTAKISLSLPTCEFESDFELAKEMTMDGFKDIPRVSTESQLVIKVLT